MLVFDTQCDDERESVNFFVTLQKEQNPQPNLEDDNFAKTRSLFIQLFWRIEICLSLENSQRLKEKSLDREDFVSL